MLFCYYNTSWPAAKGPCGPRTVFSLFPLPVCHSKPAFLRAPAIQQKPPFVPNSTKSGFVTSYFKRNSACWSLFRQVLFVLQRVPDVLDRCALNSYEPLLIVLFQYTTHRILSQVRYYFISALSISVCFLSAIWFLSCNRLSHLFRSKRLCLLLFLCRMSLFQPKTHSICIFIS